MLLRKVGSNDVRFKELSFHEGLNLLVADKTDESELGDSRNGAGKSSFVRVLRYLFGGSLDNSLKKTTQLSEHSFWMEMEMEGVRDSELLVVERFISRTGVQVGSSWLSQEEYSSRIGSWFFGFSQEHKKPTANQLLSQLIRNYFVQATKTHNAESDLESGMRIGYFLGFSPEILSKANEVMAREKQQREIKKAVKAGVLEYLDLDEAGIRTDLAKARQKYDLLSAELSHFKVDKQYAEHQKKADGLSRSIRNLNDKAVILEQRCRDLDEASNAESSDDISTHKNRQLKALYEEVGIVLPDTVAHRFDEVVAFHSSVVHNRRHFLHAEMQSIHKQLEDIAAERRQLDSERSKIMRLLDESMALETFRSAEMEVADLESQISTLEIRLKNAQRFTNIKLDLKRMGVEAETSLRTEMEELSPVLEEALTLFTQLGEEVYRDRDISLRIETTQKGVLKVTPKIDGDASAGIAEVKTFLLDLVCVVIGIKNGRAPRILVHDSQLFDSMDDRQLSSCLNIGARLAEEYVFQYIVTLNTDRLEAAEKEGFDRSNYPLDVTLTDYGETGGLFGFRFV